MEKMQELAKRKNELDVSSYQSYIRDLYSVINGQRDFADLYGYLHRNVGILGKSIKLDPDANNTFSKFVLPISWLFSLANKLNINVLEGLIKKYPGICPYCLEGKCVCYKTDKKPLRAIPIHQIKELMYFKWEEVKNDKFNLNKAVNFIMEIFPNNEVIWKTYGPRDHMLKIHEELTEIHEAFGSYMKEGDRGLDSLKDEIGDVFAWILGAWGIKHPTDSLDDAFIDYYLEDCPECKSIPCKCALHDSPPRNLPDFSKLDAVKEKLDQLITVLPNYQKDFSDLIKSYETVTKTLNTPIARATLIQTREKLEDLLRIVSTIDIEGKSSSTIYSILDIIKTIFKYEEPAETHKKDYDVFLSYSIVNKGEATKIYNYLNNKGIVVFMSEKAIQPGSVWEDIIREALNNSRLICTLASPDSLKSDWVKTEWNSAWVLRKPILPILFQCSVNELPDRLKDRQAINYHDYRKITEVLRNLP